MTEEIGDDRLVKTVIKIRSKIAEVNKEYETVLNNLKKQKKEIEVVRLFYEQDGQTLELHFYDNKLISDVPQLPVKTRREAR